MILTDKGIRDAVEAGEIIIEPFDEAQVQPASYDLRIGNEGATTTSKAKVDIARQGFLQLAPGDFGVVTSLERICLSPRYAGRIGLRSAFARRGVIATTGPQIDPGYRGRLIVGLSNPTPTPVVLPHREGLLTIEFHRLEQEVAEPYDGPYQDRDQLGHEELQFILEREGMALSEVLSTLQGLSASVATLKTSLETEVEKLTNQVGALKWAVTAVVGVVAVGVAVVGILLALD